MKRIIAATAVAAAFAAGSTQAGQTSGQFNVNINLTSTCTLSAVSQLDFAYTSLQAGASAATGGGFTMTCTTSLPYTFALRAGTPAGPFVAPFSTSLGPITDSVVNLTYSLGVSAGGSGNGTPQAYNVTGTMAGNQSGTCAAATCDNATANNRTHTLIVNY